MCASYLMYTLVKACLLAFRCLTLCCIILSPVLSSLLSKMGCLTVPFECHSRGSFSSVPNLIYVVLYKLCLCLSLLLVVLTLDSQSSSLISQSYYTRSGLIYREKTSSVVRSRFLRSLSLMYKVTSIRSLSSRQ